MGRRLLTTVARLVEIRRPKILPRSSIRISAFGLLSDFGPRISAFAVQHPLATRPPSSWFAQKRFHGFMH
jgi:hypothetical protein